MKNLKRLLSVAALACIAVFSAIAGGCVGGGEFEFTKIVPTQVTYGSEIYFREYIPAEYGAQYELYASYYDPVKGEDVVDEKQDSLLFRFEQVTDYSFTIKKTNKGKGNLSCDVECYPELPKFDNFVEYRAIKGETLILNDLLFWCQVKVTNEEYAKSDINYTYEFGDVYVKSLLVNGEDKTLNLSDKKLTDTFTFDEEAIYEFNLNAVNRKGKVPLVISVNTSNQKFHKTDVLGYVFNEKDVIEFAMGQEITADKPTDGKTVNIRMGDKKGTAVYNSAKGKYVASNFTKDLELNTPERLLVEGSSVGYSVMVVAPEVLNQSNFTKLENIIKGYVVLEEDIDMNLVDYSGHPEGKKYWGGTRSGAYADNYFNGILDGQGYTIKNFTTGGMSYTGGLLWSTSNTTIKNINFEKATVIGKNSVVVGRVGAKTKFENISIEVSSMPNKDAGVLMGPSNGDIEVKNVLMYVASIGQGDIFGTGFLAATYLELVTVENVYAITDTALPLTPEHLKIVPVIHGSEKCYVSTRANTLGNEGLIKKDDMSTELLKSSFDKLFINYMVRLRKDTIGLLQTATSDEFWLEEDIDMSKVDLNGTAEGLGKFIGSGNFTGILDGKGHTISNLRADNLFGEFAGTIKNINFTAITFEGQKGFLSATNVCNDVTIENAIFEFKQILNGSWSSLLGYQTAGMATLTNVYVDMPKSISAVQGLLTCHAITGLTLNQVYLLGGTGSYHSTGNEQYKNSETYTVDDETRGKGFYGDINEDYFILESAKSLFIDGSYNLPENIQNAYDSGKLTNIVEVTKENFGMLQTATGGYYILTSDIAFENVDLNGSEEGNGTWTPNTTFSGEFDGNGKTISNFNGMLFKDFKGTVTNVIFDNVTVTGEGLIAKTSTGDVKVTNSVFEVAEFKEGNWRGSLLGYQTAGSATLDNVYISMPTNIGNAKGFITCHAVKELNLNNVYLVGGNGLIHSTDGNATTSSGDPNEAYLLKNATINGVVAVDGNGETNLANLNGVKYFFTVNGEIYAEMNVAGIIRDAFDKGVLDKGVTEITSANVSTLLSATTGYFVLKEDIDLSGMTWLPTSSFGGVLNGNGKTIKGLTIASNHGLFKHLIGGTVKNLNINVVSNVGRSGVFGQIGKEGATIENVNVVIENKDGYCDGLFQVVQTGTVTIRNVHIYAKSGAGSFIAGEGITGSTGNLVIDGLYCYGAGTSLTGNVADGAIINGTVNEDYFIYNSDIANAIATNGTDFIKTEYARLNPTA